jgi:RHS repeat-associated protein
LGSDVRAIVTTGQMRFGYRFAFNGQEKDDEIKGQGNSYDFGARIYDSRLGKWMSLDPHWSRYPSLSSYVAFANSPISILDGDGRDIVYFNSTGKEIHRVVSNTEFRTFIPIIKAAGNPVENAHNYSEAAMPKVISERTQSGENVSGSQYQENDYLIAARTGLFNQDKNNGNLQLYTENGDPIPKDITAKIPDLDPTLVKAIAIQESNNGVTGVTDILTANNAGDWKTGQKMKEAYGLAKNDDLSSSNSLYYGLRILASKGYKGGIGYNKSTGEKSYSFQGWSSATDDYNGGGVVGYQGYVETMTAGAVDAQTRDYTGESQVGPLQSDGTF